jgi:transcription initiation factor TFIIF subunit alpha
MPKFGAGSEYGREEREEARKKKYGYNAKKYDPDRQPWLMRIGGKKDGKHYRGNREGGVSDNTAFYVFTHAPDGSFEAHPIKEWYNFIPRVTYRYT